MAPKHDYRLLDDHVTPPRSFLKLLTLALCLFCSVWLTTTFLETRKDNVVEPEKPRLSPIFERFYECVYPKLLPLKGNYDEFWSSFVNLTKECDDLDAYKSLDIRSMENADETKYVLYPKKEENITMVTLGIGHDVKAEMKLKTLYPKTDFFGVDPVPEINKDLYENQLGGTFFQMAISGKGGVYKSHILKKGYSNQMTMHIGADYFFGEMLRKPKIDILWVDTEGHEYTFIELLHRDGALDKRAVHICQINVEMHKNTFGEPMGEKQKFHDFVWRVLEDGKYIMLKPFYVYWGNYGFIRTFIVNVADPECAELYLN